MRASSRGKCVLLYPPALTVIINSCAFLPCSYYLFSVSTISNMGEDRGFTATEKGKEW
jgi:hypothetical protein